MAEIKIEPTKKPTWPWIVVAIIAIAIILLIVFWRGFPTNQQFKGSQDTEQVQPPTPEPGN